MAIHRMDMRPRVYILRRKLHKLGWETLSEWARLNGYKPLTVNRVVKRHWGQRTKPVGELTISILDGLRQTVDKRIGPDDLTFRKAE